MEKYGSIANLILALLGLATLILVVVYPLIERKIDEVAFKTNKKAHKKSTHGNWSRK